MSITIAVANNKGGVGKSLLTVQAAGALARTGRRVLVVDMDPQANATRRLGVTWDPDHPIPTLVEALAIENIGALGAAADAVTPCTWEQPEGRLIDVLPSRRDLANREPEAGLVGAIERLREALHGWTDTYDVVLIDTPPHQGHLAQMALAAADQVLIVTKPEYDSVEGVLRITDFVTTRAKYIGNPDLRVGGVIINAVRETAEARYQVEGITETFADLLWNLQTWKIPGVLEATPAHIPLWSRFDETDSAACSASAWTDARGRTATAIFDQVANHIVQLAPTAAASH